MKLLTLQLQEIIDIKNLYGGEVICGLIKLKPTNDKRRLSFKEAKELKELDLKLPLLEKQKIYLEKKITDSDVDISEVSHQLAVLIESIQEYEDRGMELSEVSESAK